jgi:hypothetical protein
VGELVVGAVGVILGSFLSLIREMWIYSRDRNKRATYLAILVSMQLEKFLRGCAHVSGDTAQTTDSGEYFTRYSLPCLNFDELDIDWQSLPPDLMRKLMTFPSRIQEANEMIASVSEHHSPGDFETIEEQIFQYSKLGLKANKLAIELREYINLPKKKYINWDPVNKMNQELAKVETSRKRRAKSFEALYVKTDC